MTYEKNRSDFLDALTGAAKARRDREYREVRIRGRIAVVSVLVGVLVGSMLTAEGLRKYRQASGYYDQRLMAFLEQHYSLFGKDSQPIVQDRRVCSANL